MLKFFRSQTTIFPFAIIVLLMFFMRVNVFANDYFEMHWESNLSPLSLALKSVMGDLLTKNVWFNLVSSAFLVFLQSSIVVSILNYFRVEEFKGFLAAWLYVVLLHLFPAFVFLSPELIAITFILLALRSFVYIDESKSKLEPIVTAGLLLSIAAGFWLPSIFFLPLAIFAMAKENLLSLKTLMSLLLAFSMVFIYSYAYLYLTDKPLKLINGLQLNQFEFHFYKKQDLLSFTILVVITLFSLPSIMTFLNKLLKKPKIFFQTLLAYVICFFVLILFQNQNKVTILIVLAFPVSIILAIYFNRFKRIFLAEAIHLVLLLSVIVNFIYFLK